MNLVDKYKDNKKKKVEKLFEEEIPDKNKVFAFYGVCGNQFKLEDVVFEAIEDPDDGYRSYLDTIKVIDSDGIFQRTPLGYVYILGVEEGSISNYGDSFSGYALVDITDNHVWLVIGTDNTDDYYPSFVFHYQIREDVLETQRN
jgi:hypothetical protein